MDSKKKKKKITHKKAKVNVEVEKPTNCEKSKINKKCKLSVKLQIQKKKRRNMKMQKPQIQSNGSTKSIPQDNANVTAELPISKCKKNLLSQYEQNDVLIIVGETGCGKSTQVPKFIYRRYKKELRGNNKVIGITQPRRVAAISLAHRVADEMNLTMGLTVGYSVRFDEKYCKKTRIKYMTDGMLLMESQKKKNKKFGTYRCLILDEIHERTINTDLLLGLAKQAQEQRVGTNNPLKLVLMSATMDVDNIQSYFPRAQVVFIKGLMHPVDIKYFCNREGNYLELTLLALLKAHEECDMNRDILVFLTGKEEIEYVVNTLRSMVDINPCVAVPLYAALPHHMQMKALKPAPKGRRKIVVATNVAETSLTIPNIGIVIDCGRVKSKFYNEHVGIEYLRIQMVSRAQAEQRAGRTGRDCPGMVIRTYSEEDTDNMQSYNVPEILRSNLSGAILRITAKGFTKIKSFPWLDAPSKEGWKGALRELADMNALESPKQPLVITPLGHFINLLPLDPQIGKVVAMSSEFGVMRQVCAIVAVMSGDRIFQANTTPNSLGFGWQSFLAPEGDLITYLNIFKAFKKSKSQKQEFCRRYSFNLRALLFAEDVYKHLVQICQSAQASEEDATSPKKRRLMHQNKKENGGMSVDEMKENILKCFVEYLPRNRAVKRGRNMYSLAHARGVDLNAKLHPSSSLLSSKPSVVLFCELSENSDKTLHMMHCSYVDPTW